MKTPPSYFTLTKSQRRGIVWTLAIFLALHLGFRFYPKPQPNSISGLVLDSLMQRRVDSLIAIKPDFYKNTIYSFNPNFISDYKGYQLDISMEVVHRIRAFRAAGNYINSIQVFKQVSQLSDGEINRIQVYLKLPKPRFTTPKQVKRTKKEFKGATVAD